MASLGPTLVVALWATSYLADCFQHLLAPGGALVVPYQTRAGIVTLRAESYTIDPFVGAILIRGLSVEEPSGDRLGDAASLQVRFAGLRGPQPDRASGFVQVVADSVRLKLRRDPQGRLPVLDYLPEPTDEESTTPFVVRISDAVVDWVDEVGDEPWSTRIRVEEVYADGVGLRWSARGRVQWQEGGRLSASIRSNPDAGLWGEVDFEQVAIDAVVDRLKKGPSFEYRDDLLPVTSRGLIATGRLAIARPPGAPIQFRSVLQAEADLLGYDNRYVGRNVRYTGFVSNDGLSGEASGIVGQTQAAFTGSVRWTEGVRVAGRVLGTAGDRLSLPDWLRSLVPAGLEFEQGKADGWLAYSDDAGVRYDGTLHAEAVRYSGERFSGLQTRVTVTPRRFAAVVDQASWRGAPVTGRIDAGLADRSLAGFFESPTVPVAPLLADRNVRGVRANLAARAFLGGTLDRPIADLRVAGNAQVELESSRWVPLRDLQVFVLLHDGSWTIERAVANGPGDSVLAASGGFDLARGGLDVKVFASGIQLRDFVDSVGGALAAEGQITGTLTAPVFLGNIEVYALNIDAIDIPLITAGIRADRESVSLADVRATRGPGRLYAGLRYRFSDQSVEGRFRADGIELSDWFDGDLAGALSVVDGVVEGTLAAPVVTADVETDELILRGVDLGRARAGAEFRSGLLTLNDAMVRGPNGRLSAGGTFDLASLSGELSVQADSLVLSRLLTDLPDRTTVGGTASGTAWVSVYEGRIVRAAGSGTIQDLTVNPTYLGNGLWNFEAEGTRWTGNVLVGQPGRYIQLEDILVDAGYRLSSGALVAYDVPVRDLWFAVRPYLVPGVSLDQPGRTALPTAVVDQLDRLDGRVDADLKWSGVLDDPTIEAPALAVRDLEFAGQPNGSVQISAGRRRGTWTFREARWRGGPGNIRIAGRLVEGGDVDFEGTVSNFDPNWLSQLVPGWPTVSGRASLDFVATGPVASPVVQATLSASLFDTPASVPSEGAAAVPVASSPLNIQLSDILVQDGAVSVGGLMNYRGFSGRLEGSAPFRFPLEFPTDAPISFLAELPRTELRRLVEFVPSMDTAATEGGASIRLIVDGTISAPRLAVEADLEASRFALVGSSTRAENVQASVRTVDGRVVVRARADSSRGGSVDAEASVGVREVLDRLGEGADSLLRTAVAGTAAIRNLAAADSFGRDGRVDAVIDGDVLLTGTLGRAVLTSPNRIAVRKLELVVPSELPAAGPGGSGVNLPQLDLGFVFGSRSSPIEVRVTNAAFDLIGEGTLRGPLLAPNATADLEVVEGAIRLPNARIALDEGGTVRFSYDPAADPLNTTRLDVAVTGRTSLAASRFPGLVERFDIRLDVRGDMLRPNTQSIVANSDPPGLSQERILALLGQSQVFESLSLDRDGGLEQRLGQAAAGFAIPVLLDPITAEFARDFGLDYLNFEYNAFEGPSVAAAKTLSRSWAIQARRQLIEQPGFAIQYDLRLTYTPFRRNRFARNVVFSFGQDQDRPWKIAVEYTERF